VHLASLDQLAEQAMFHELTAALGAIAEPPAAPAECLERAAALGTR
jgi:hypothetical protein